MPQLNIDSSEFADIVVCFLYDKIQNPSDVVEYDLNENFNALMEVMARRGLKAPLLQVWMDMDPQTRVKYRLIKDVFRDNPKTQMAVIKIEKEERTKVMKQGVFDRIKKAAKVMIAAIVGKKIVDAVKGKDGGRYE